MNETNVRDIVIIRGEEFKALTGNNGSTAFETQHKMAERYFSQIIEVNGKLKGENDLVNCVNNIIAFSGERGQGKTTAMNCFLQSVRERNKQCHILDVIDPSTFESMHNIVEVIVSKMFNETKYPPNVSESEGYEKLLDQFQVVYESLSLIRNATKFDNLEDDYEGTIEKLSRVGDSANLRKDMQKLVDQYLDETIGTDKKFLIIPIDDLDISISLAYKMAEQIRKYLIVPSVLISY